MLVFKTIAENIKSFFGREDELEHDPKKVPDAAIELYEKPITKDHAIIGHSLKESPVPLASAPVKQTPKKLPFSSAQLKERLVMAADQSSQSSHPSQRSGEGSSSFSSVATAPAHPEARQPEMHEEDLSSQIKEFEQAMGTVPGADVETELHAASASSGTEGSAAWPYGEGFFAHVAKRLKGHDYDDTALENALDRMKEHHARRHAESEQQVKQQELEHGLSQKLVELQGLEREWASKSGEVEAARQRMTELEGLIAERTGELRELVSQLHEHGTFLGESVLASGSVTSPRPAPEHARHDSEALPKTARDELRESPPEQGLDGRVPAPKAAHSFILADGRELVSMQDLREALLAMGDATFHHHVTPERNDFSTWILDVFKDRDLAERVRHAPNKYVMAQLLG